MKNGYLIAAVWMMLLLCISCSKKTNPSGSSRSVYGTEGKTSNESKTVVVKPVKTPTPKVIVVNDNIASKTFDGRLYYDLEGHRYWKNYKDGKFYLYNKSMNNDPDFKKP